MKSKTYQKFKIKAQLVDGTEYKGKVIVEGEIPEDYKDDPVEWFLDCCCSHNSIKTSDGFITREHIIRASIKHQNEDKKYLVRYSKV